MKASVLASVYSWLESVAPNADASELAYYAEMHFGKISWSYVSKEKNFLCEFGGIKGKAKTAGEALEVAVALIIPPANKAAKKKVPTGGRIACSVDRVNPKQFTQMVENAFDGNGISPREFHKLGNKFQKDIGKVNFDFENWDFCTNKHFSKGKMKASDGTEFSYIGMSAGGDWEFPIYFMIYLDKDGKTFRGYIPKEGNPWNYKTKEAFGNDDEADDKFLRSWLKKNDPNLLEEYEDDDDSYEFTHDTIDISDEELMVKKISERFVTT